MSAPARTMNRRDRRAHGSAKMQRALMRQGVRELVEIRDRAELDGLGLRWAREHGARGRLLLALEKPDRTGFDAMLLTGAFVRSYDAKTGQSHAARLETRTADDVLVVAVEDVEGDADYYELAIPIEGR